MIKAIEQIYKGVRFRSTLEARYAIYFDALPSVLSWEYEPEGYEMDDGTRYLPDFLIKIDPENEDKYCLRDNKGWFFVEIKPESFSLAHPYMKRLEKFTSSDMDIRLMLFIGRPSLNLVVVSGCYNTLWGSESGVQRRNDLWDACSVFTGFLMHVIYESDGELTVEDRHLNPLTEEDIDMSGGYNKDKLKAISVVDAHRFYNPQTQ